MKRIDIDSAIKSHTQWRRQFLNAFAGGNYADMPLSAHRSCMLAITLSKVEDLPEIMKYGVMSTPGVVVDGKVVHAGGTPDRAKISTWL